METYSQQYLAVDSNGMVYAGLIPSMCTEGQVGQGFQSQTVQKGDRELGLSTNQPRLPVVDVMWPGASSSSSHDCLPPEPGNWNKVFLEGYFGVGRGQSMLLE